MTLKTGDQIPPKPSARQVYCLAHHMADLLDLAWPKDRREASRLIKALEAQRDAMAGARA